MDDQHAPRTTRVGWIVGTLALMGLAFSSGFVLAGTKAGAATIGKAVASTAQVQIEGVDSKPPTTVGAPADFTEFWDLWHQLEEQYYQQPVDEKKMMYGAMAGLTASMGDPYTTYFEPKAASDFSTSLAGKFEGIGAEIGIKDGQLQVISPLADMPAEKAGLRAGDAILKINATDTADMTVEAAVALIRGPKGTPVSLLIGRNTTVKDAKGKESTKSETKEVTIIRDTIVVKSVRLKWPADRIARIEVTNFNQDTSVLFNQVLDEALKKDPKGIILDLRNDPGGYLDKATDIAGEWLGSQIVVMERRQGKIVEQLPGTGSGRLKDIPTIVLINQGSASASEIVAGALRDYGKATLVGMKSFGKGSVQDYTEFPDKSAVKITIAEWLTPKGDSINKTGIVPDVTVDMTQDDYNANKDPQLDKALELLGIKPAAKPVAKPASKKAAPKASAQPAK